jgi:hypothetical protein
MLSSLLGLLGQVRGRKSLLGAPSNEVGVRGCRYLLGGFVDAPRLIPPHHSPESDLTVLYLCVLHSFFASVCPASVDVATAVVRLLTAAT